jgi:hypothetical protein
MITTRAVPALLPTHHRRVAVSPATIRNDFADPCIPEDHEVAAQFIPPRPTRTKRVTTMQLPHIPRR